jgi:hypothetical protein
MFYYLACCRLTDFLHFLQPVITSGFVRFVRFLYDFCKKHIYMYYKSLYVHFLHSYKISSNLLREMR